MFEEEEFKNPTVSNDLQDQINSTKTSRISVFMDKVHSVDGLYFISSLLQLFLGSAVVALSLVGSIQPVWVATLMTVFGSITMMSGLFMLHRTIVFAGTFDSLLQKAIKQVINNQN
ncbi:hypothetical protein [Rhodohalobacter sp.]|uniref:hypothetical protein n=1 Tax=Rhodohalobacter sp. TaxID=1974210 RepID=UPI002ACE0D95|nr:hypothetical protein [Rhodohalobacter sp.]MDZ7756392.1 hypothetical protein [Rhodohalobacter sp.]